MIPKLLLLRNSHQGFLFEPTPGKIATRDTTKCPQLKIHQSNVSIVNHKTNPCPPTLIRYLPTVNKKEAPN